MNMLYVKSTMYLVIALVIQRSSRRDKKCVMCAAKRKRIHLTIV